MAISLKLICLFYDYPYFIRIMAILGHWDDPEGWCGEGGGRRVQDGEHMYTN